MTDYLVRWEIDVEAETPQAAAAESLRIMRDPDSTATVFDVFADDKSKPERIDLADDTAVGPDPRDVLTAHLAEGLAAADRVFDVIANACVGGPNPTMEAFNRACDEDDYGIFRSALDAARAAVGRDADRPKARHD